MANALLVRQLRLSAPLVHSITNMVVMNLNANVLLAAGASPVMAHAHEEVQAMAGIALACGAHGVHLGQSDLPPNVARTLLPPQVFIGWSVETMVDVERSATLPVDYLGVSPVFATPTKTDTATPWGLQGLQRVRTATPLPLVAIGGIHAHNATAVMQAGAHSLAVVSAICAANDPRAAAQKLRSLIDAP